MASEAGESEWLFAFYLGRASLIKAAGCDVFTSEFDYILPPERIAQRPVEPRDRSRLMVVRPGRGEWEHRVFADLPELLRAGDVLVRNVSKVLPARLIGVRAATGGRCELLFLRTRDDGDWELLAATRGRLKEGEEVELEGGLRVSMLERMGSGMWRARPSSDAPAVELLARHGHVPLPPYIRKGQDCLEDRTWYQTVYAAEPGSVAAPTAGLHFTPELIARLEHAGVRFADVTLHVGIGTFRPIEAERIEDHELHAEWGEVSEAAVRRISDARQCGGRVVAVGTTSARVLEQAACAGGGVVREWSGETRLYIRPGHVFGALAGLITNFHLPRSSLLVLVAALTGVDLLRAAYEEAIRREYRFYSYGDAMLILDESLK